MTARHPRLLALAALSLALLVALALRLPQLQEVPHLTDEAGEVLWAHAITFDGARPLTHNDAYNGPLWAYLLAGVFGLLGASPELPRQFALALGLLAVGLTFGLGAQLARREARWGAGLVAGLLLATNFTHSLVNSRVPWSNSSTPVWTTLTALVLVAACRRRQGSLLVLAGLLGGLALQTHPSVSVFLAGAALWFLLDGERRRWLRQPWPWLAVAVAVLAYSPVLVHNLTHGFDTLSEARASRNFADESGVPWLSGVAGLLVQLGRSMSGGFTPDGADPTWSPFAWAYAALALGAVLLLARDRGASIGRRLPLVVVATAVLALPLFNANWQGLLEARYLGYLWPLVCAALGSLVAEAWLRAGRAGRMALAGAVLALAAVPALRLQMHNQAALASGFDNRRLWHMLAAIDEAPGAAPVLVDEALRDTRWRAGGHPRRALEYLLTLDGVPFDRAPTDKMSALLTSGGADWLLLSGPTAEQLAERYGLEPADVMPRPGEAAWGLYRRRVGE
jgi:4-amino-4-deoxy-L-arabinose transferase-like glycosyltransferase